MPITDSHNFHIYCISGVSNLFVHMAKWTVFTTRCYASVEYAVVMCPSIRLSQASIVSKLLNKESRK